MIKSQCVWIHAAKLLANGGNGSLSNDCRVLKNIHEWDVPVFFPPEVIVEVKALACEQPSKYSIPISRWNISDIARTVQQTGLVASISNTTIWRWLHEDAIKPWQHRCWIFPRDPQFTAKASLILDLYAQIWDNKPLREDEFVLSADEKTSIQARRRKHPTVGTKPGSAMKVEHEYTRCGAWAYIAALDVHRAKLFGRCEEKNGIAPFERLVAQVMNQSPYKDARRVFWIVDNGSSHRGIKCIERLKQQYPRIHIVHGPVHASWLNQIEIYFSILQRKALTPNDFSSLQVAKERILGFQDYYQSIAKPFNWEFTKKDLFSLLNKIQLPTVA